MFIKTHALPFPYENKTDKSAADKSLVYSYRRRFFQLQVYSYKGIAPNLFALQITCYQQKDTPVNLMQQFLPYWDSLLYL